MHRLGEAAAIDKMRLCVKRHNESVGTANSDTGGYQETITIAWIKLLAGLLRVTGPMERAAFAAWAVEHFVNDRGIFSRYYDFDLPGSVEARRTWVAPTLASFD